MPKLLHTLDTTRRGELAAAVAEKPVPFLLSLYAVVFGEVGFCVGGDAGA